MRHLPVAVAALREEVITAHRLAPLSAWQIELRATIRSVSEPGPGLRHALVGLGMPYGRAGSAYMGCRAGWGGCSTGSRKNIGPDPRCLACWAARAYLGNGDQFQREFSLAQDCSRNEQGFLPSLGPTLDEINRLAGRQRPNDDPR